MNNDCAFNRENINKQIRSACVNTPYIADINYRSCEQHPSGHEEIVVYFKRDGERMGGCSFTTIELFEDKEWTTVVTQRIQSTFKLFEPMTNQSQRSNKGK